MRARSPFLAGFLAGLPFVIVIVPFGLLFGVVAREGGLTALESIAMSILVIAGAAQFASVQLLSDGAPVLVAVATGLAVNLRMVMYSAAIAPRVQSLPFRRKAVMAYFLVDQTFGVIHQKLEDAPDLPADSVWRYFIGAAFAICVPWYLSSYAGFAVGRTIPPELALDFALPITFIALFAPSLRSAAHVAAALVAASLALALAWVPLNGGLILAAIAGMITGAAVETRLAGST